MPDLKGEFLRRGTGFAVRVAIKGKTRKVFALGPRGESTARERARVVGDMAAELRRAKQAHSTEGLKLLELAALGNSRTMRGAQSAAQALVAGELEDVTACPTFKAVAADWTSGKLHKQFPDHVKAKESDDDRERLKWVCATDLGGGTFGELPIDQIRVEHCEAVMRNLPERARRPATRRHYGQVISRVLALATYPLRLIEKSPLPKNFLPKVGRPPAYHYLYPEDDRALLDCADVDLGRRVYWGWVAREGGRKGETARLRVRDFDLERGVCRVDKNKTDDPRSWVMTPGVAEALRAWVALRRLKPSDLMFGYGDGHDFTGDESRTAELLRADLEVAGLKQSRPELFERTPQRSWMRMHDLRGTFVTLSLAAGRSETWVADRTGHKSSTMINRYRRRAREVEELGIGELDRLDQAIPELRDWLAGRPYSAHFRSGSAAGGGVAKSEKPIIPGSAEGGTRTPTRLPSADFESPRTSIEQGAKHKTRGPSDEERRGATARGPDMGQIDPVEAALAESLTRASQAQQWDVVAQLARELEARRRARADVVEIGAPRRGKGGAR